MSTVENQILTGNESLTEKPVMSLEEMYGLLSQVQEQAFLSLQEFAVTNDFAVKMASMFGEENNYSTWQTAFATSTFTDFPTIEILPRSILQGANAAYAGPINTIYFSQDFLTQYVNDTQTLAAVFIEEFGHHVDWQVNAGIDTPGDEGELFSSVVRGVELTASQVKQMQQENDFVVLNMDSSTAMPRTTVLSGNSSIAESNITDKYHWADFDDLYKSIRDSRPITQVVAINGILTPNFDSPRNDLNSQLNLADDPDEYGNGLGNDSIDFVGIHNPSSSEVSPNASVVFNVYEEAHAVIADLLFKKAIENYKLLGKPNFETHKGGYLLAHYAQKDPRFLGEEPSYFTGPEIENLKELGFLVENLSDINSASLGATIGSESVRNLDGSPSLVSIKTLSITSQLDKLTRFLVQYGDVDSLYSSLSEKIKGEAPNDLLEAFAQFFSNSELEFSKKLNSEWLQSSLEHLTKSSSNSVILLAHSQGNFFLEDGLKSLKEALLSFSSSFDPDGEYFTENLVTPEPNDFIYAPDVQNYLDQINLAFSKLKVVSLGSPTDYNLEGNDLSKHFDISFYRRPADPIVDLQLQGDFSWINKISTFLSLIPFLTDVTKVARNLGIGHGLVSPIGFGGGYLIDVKESFADYFSQLNPTGYYFPNGERGIFLDFDGEGTRFGDYIRGTGVGDRIDGLEGNDILRGGFEGGFGSDRLIGGSGWDILDGGLGGQDEADYGDSPSGILVEYQYFPGGDTYEVWDGYEVAGQRSYDYLIEIEKISGSYHNDLFWGGYGSDKFYARDGEDTFLGQGGDDFFDGGKGNDTFWGGSGNDTFNEGDLADGDDYFDGGSGTDFFYGGDGDDTAYGGSENDTLYGENGKDYLYGGSGDDFIAGGFTKNSSGWSWWSDGVVEQDGNDNGPKPVPKKRDQPGDYGTSAEANFSVPNLQAFGTTPNRLQILGEASFTFFVEANTSPDLDEGDVIYAGSGNDIVYGDGGDDLIFGENGRDLIFGGVGDDQISGGNHDDEIHGDDGDDLIHGDDGNDTIFGGDDNDIIAGDAGDDTITGDSGDDTISGGLGNDDIQGNDGVDTINGDDGNDTISGGNDNDIIAGDAGDDTITGDSGDDTISGGLGNDNIQGNDGADTINGDDGNDTISGGDDNDVIYGDDGNDNLYGDNGADTLYGGTGDDNLHGGDGNDSLYGEEGNDNLYGGNGDDYMVGGPGMDFFDGGNGEDLISFKDAPSAIAFSLKAGGWLGEAFGDRSINVENLEGSLFDDYLIGDDLSNKIYGLAGNDTIEGYDGDDWLYGGLGNDILRGGQGNDTLYGDEGDDYLDGGLGDDILYGGTGNNHLDAGEGNNIITAGDGNNLVYAGPGSDTITLGDGNNQIYAGEGQNVITVGRGDNLIYGGASADIITVGDGNNQIYAAEGNNVITVTGFGVNTIDTGYGDDLVYGGAGSDRIVTRGGNDTIYAAEGNNYIDAGDGVNTIFSGSGADTFVLGWGSQNTIMQFDVGQDKLGLSQGLQFGQLDISQGSKDGQFFTEIKLAWANTPLATLNWTQAADIDSSSFINV